MRMVKARGASRKRARSTEDTGGRGASKRKAALASLEQEEIESEPSDDERGEEGPATEDEENGHEETAEEKRLRLAKAYLDRMRTDARGSADEADEDEDAAVTERLRQDQMEAAGMLQRKIAARVVAPASGAEQPLPVDSLWRGHRLSITSVVLSHDDATAYSASKDGAIFQWDVETSARTRFQHVGDEEPSTSAPTANGHANGHAVSDGHSGRRKGKGKGGKGGKGGGGHEGSRHTLCLSLSSDGRFLASGGYDRKVRVWDARTHKVIRAFPGHKDAVSCLSFREGTHELFSGSYDRSIKQWSIDDLAYMDSLFGHQSEVLSLAVLKRERAVSTGRDHTCRLWKIPEETQLVYRGHGESIDCCAMISHSDWITGSDDGSLSLWNFMKKKPALVIRDAHGGGVGSAAVGLASGWMQSVAVCRGADLAASGAGDGAVRLWALEDNNRRLRPLYSFAARGFTNALCLAHSGRFVLAGVGQEPRLGRWGRTSAAKNGIIMHRINLSDAVDEDE
eukprot:jgi/Chlat1/4222/Chrsp27S04299